MYIVHGSAMLKSIAPYNRGIFLVSLTSTQFIPCFLFNIAYGLFAVPKTIREIGKSWKKSFQLFESIQEFMSSIKYLL